MTLVLSVGIHLEDLVWIPEALGLRVEEGLIDVVFQFGPDPLRIFRELGDRRKGVRGQIVDMVFG